MRDRPIKMVVSVPEEKWESMRRLWEIYRNVEMI
jgi:hypothetical protein